MPINQFGGFLLIFTHSFLQDMRFQRSGLFCRFRQQCFLYHRPRAIGCGADAFCDGDPFGHLHRGIPWQRVVGAQKVGARIDLTESIFCARKHREHGRCGQHNLACVELWKPHIIMVRIGRPPRICYGVRPGAVYMGRNVVRAGHCPVYTLVTVVSGWHGWLVVAVFRRAFARAVLFILNEITQPLLLFHYTGLSPRCDQRKCLA